MHMHIYIYGCIICIYICIHVYICIHINIHIYIYVYIYIYIYGCTYIWIYSHIFFCMCKAVCTYIHTNIHMYINLNIHMYVQPYIILWHSRLQIACTAKPSPKHAHKNHLATILPGSNFRRAFAFTNCSVCGMPLLIFTLLVAINSSWRCWPFIRNCTINTISYDAWVWRHHEIQPHPKHSHIRNCTVNTISTHARIHLFIFCSCEVVYRSFFTHAICTSLFTGECVSFTYVQHTLCCWILNGPWQQTLRCKRAHFLPKTSPAESWGRRHKKCLDARSRVRAVATFYPESASRLLR